MKNRNEDRGQILTIQQFLIDFFNFFLSKECPFDTIQGVK